MLRERETSVPISNEELREFLEADELDVLASPRFKELLKQRLWELVCCLYGGSSGRGEA